MTEIAREAFAAYSTAGASAAGSAATSATGSAAGFLAFAFAFLAFRARRPFERFFLEPFLPLLRVLDLRFGLFDFFFRRDVDRLRFLDELFLDVDLFFLAFGVALRRLALLDLVLLALRLGALGVDAFFEVDRFLDVERFDALGVFDLRLVLLVRLRDIELFGVFDLRLLERDREVLADLALALFFGALGVDALLDVE